MLGCVCLCGPSACTGGCTGGGPRKTALSSSTLPESAVPTPPDAWEGEESGRAPRPANGSFWGGAGASSVGVGVASAGASPNGPRGSTESSTDSSLVACALILRVPRGPLLPGTRTAGELSDAGGCAAAVW